MKRHPPGGPFATNGTPVGGFHRQNFAKQSWGGHNSGKVESINGCTLEEGGRIKGNIITFGTHRRFASLILNRWWGITLKRQHNRTGKVLMGRKAGEISVSPART